MKPILHNGSTGTINFANSTRIGTLTDCISCKVTEERNGPYELEMEASVSGMYYNNIINGNIIMAVPYDGADEAAFEIYKVSRPINGRVKVKAKHITHRLQYCIVRPGSIPHTYNIEGRLSGEYYGQQSYGNLLVNQTPFKVRAVTSFAEAGSVTITKPQTLRETLQGSTGSIAQVMGGEWEWRNDGAYLRQKRGTTRKIGIAYGKNLVDLKQEEAIENTYDAAFPFWADDTTVVVGDIKNFAQSPLPYRRVKLLDLSSEFDEAPTVTQLNSRCQTYVNANCRGVPNVSLTVRFAPLWQALGYEDTELEHIQLCDEVPVIFEQLGVSTTAKVIKTDYNVLTERYNSIELGSERLTAAKAISRLSKAAGVSLYT